MTLFLLWSLISVAEPECSEPVNTYLEQVGEQPDLKSYMCLIQEDLSVQVILDALPTANSVQAPRFRRALTLALLHRADKAWEPNWVSVLSPTDRRVLADGVKARKGRKSPSAEHHAIFQQFAWYQPRPLFTENQLTPLDRRQIKLADDPKKFMEIPEPADETRNTTDRRAVPQRDTCGCGSVGSVGGAFPWAWAILGVMGLRRNGRQE